MELRQAHSKVLPDHRSTVTDSPAVELSLAHHDLYCVFVMLQKKRQKRADQSNNRIYFEFEYQPIFSLVDRLMK